MFFNNRTSPIGIDLGTANTIVVAAGNGIVFDEPTICCFEGFDAAPRLVAAGEEASRYVGRIAKPLKIVRPLRNGVLSDMRAARELLHFAKRSIGKRRGLNLVQPIIGIPADATQSEQRALETAAVDAGFGSPRLVPEPLLAAIGAGLTSTKRVGEWWSIAVPARRKWPSSRSVRYASASRSAAAATRWIRRCWITSPFIIDSRSASVKRSSSSSGSQSCSKQKRPRPQLPSAGWIPLRGCPRR